MMWEEKLQRENGDAEMKLGKRKRSQRKEHVEIKYDADRGFAVGEMWCRKENCKEEYVTEKGNL